MDRLLKPKDLTIEPRDPDASRVFEYWLATFENFVESALPARADDNNDDNERQRTKRNLLINFLSPAIYPHVEDCESYDVALQTPKDLYIKPDGDSSEVALTSTTSSVKIHGFVNVNASVVGNDYHLKLGVIDKLCADIILGQDFLKLHESVTIKMGGSQPSISICNEQERKATCSVSMAKISPPRLFQFVDCKSCIPIATKSREFKEEDKKFIKEEISKLLTEGIIEPSELPWRAQVLVTKNERHKKRMVIDYSQTINRYIFKDAYPLPRIDEQINALAQCKVFSTLDLKSAYYQIPIAEKDRPYTAFEADGRLYHYCRLPFGLTNGVSAFQRIIDSLIQRNKLKRTYAHLDNITVAGETQEIHDSNLKAFLQTAFEANLTFNESKSNFLYLL